MQNSRAFSTDSDSNHIRRSRPLSQKTAEKVVEISDGMLTMSADSVLEFL
jgi:hypothetical protein